MTRSQSSEHECPGNLRQIKVSVEITHTYIGDLRLELVAPSGRSAVLRSGLDGGQNNLVESYDSAAPSSPLAPLLGQSMQGAWTLRVADVVSIDVGTLNKWSLELVVAA
jgi:subtilisin-like proprotein convertase family protein